ncbi:hypothetical protein HDU83_002528 [Entophlyctis luteolus]|nr:hypothetical protein HDU83_002528 [Entophlyctis luteolus]KAJ3383021.1 hypothetical protein HDU84_003891 [Entophlyctis sp. JEL0112]
MQQLLAQMPALVPPLMMLPAKPADAKSHFVHAYVRANSHHLDRLREAIDAYIRNLERIKRKTIKKAVLLRQFADLEMLPATTAAAISSPSARHASTADRIGSSDDAFGIMLANFSEMLLEKEEARDDLIARVNVMCHEPLKVYGSLCQKLKEEVRSRDSAVMREQAKQQQFDRAVMKDAGNRPKLNTSQLELAGAAQQVAQATESLIQNTEKFEAKKREDIKAILSELLWSEIKYHAKVLEILSAHHQKLGGVEFGGSVDFSRKMTSFTSQSPLSPRRSTFSPF